MDSLITALHVLADYCDYGALHDDLIRYRIVVGLRDRKLSEKLQLDPKLSLESVILMARQNATVEKQQSVVRGATSPEAAPSLDAIKFQKKKRNAKKTSPHKQTKPYKLWMVWKCYRTFP